MPDENDPKELNSDDPTSESPIENPPSQFLTREISHLNQTSADTPPSSKMPLRMGHYEIDKLIGSGGMGQVFKAYDSTLKRFVALKLLHTDDPRLAERFLQEARAQASVEHENVCKVYEVGDTNGKQFIAMQLIQGQTLAAASRNMTVEKKVQVIKRIAEALQAAHREGLIHRDVKPTNIMVEKTEAGDWKPYIMDFGLAREQSAAGLTMTGYVVGTPHYMSPEQARGEKETLDRRTDIYGLGATLYEILAGQPLFQGSSGAEVLLKVLSDEPLALRKVQPSIQEDLETIVMKCLEKDPERRYVSAKEFADDLGRYLDGEPISARPVSWSYRLIKKAKRNQVATTILTAALIVTLSLIASLLYVQWRARTQARYAREFGDEIRNIDSMLRSVYAAPLHDVTSEIQLVQRRLTEIEKRTSESGKWAYGAGHHALGLGYLALNDIEKAGEHLHLAWNANYQEASTAYALGRVMGSQYERSLKEVESIQNKILREEKRKKIEKELKEPAVAFLKGARSNVESIAYAEGLISLYEKRYADALKKASEAYRQASWSYEAMKLEGDVYLAMGHDFASSGDHEKALKSYDAAGAAYARAADMGRSRSEIYLADADRWIAVINSNTAGGLSPESALQSALNACDKSSIINSKSQEGYVRKSKAYSSVASYMMYSAGKDPRELIGKSIQNAQQAIQLNPKDAGGFQQSCFAHRVFGEYEIRHGIDPRNKLMQGIDSCDKALKLDSNDTIAAGTSGICYTILGEYELKHGSDPRPTYYKAIDRYKNAVRISRSNTGALTGAGVAYWYIGSYEMGIGKDPSSSFREAIAQYDEVRKINPKLFAVSHNTGLAYMYIGKYQRRIGANPIPSFQQSLKYMEEGLKLNPNTIQVHSGIASVYGLIAEYSVIVEGKDPADSLNAGRVAAEKGIQLDPAYYEPYVHFARLEIVKGQWLIQQHQDPTKYFDSARKILRKAIQLNDQEFSTYQVLAETFLYEAKWKQEENSRAKDSIENGLKCIEQALEISPNDPESVALQGTFYLLKAREEKQPAAKVSLAGLAEDSFERALKSNPLLKKEYELLLKEAISISALVGQ